MNVIDRIKLNSSKTPNDTVFDITDKDLDLQSERGVPGHKKNQVASSIQTALISAKKFSMSSSPSVENGLLDLESKETKSQTKKEIHVPLDKDVKSHSKKSVPEPKNKAKQSPKSKEDKPIDGDNKVDTKLDAPIVEISEVKERVPDKKKDNNNKKANMELGNILASAALIEIEEDNKKQIPNKKPEPETETETANQSDEEVAAKQKQSKRMTDLSKVQEAFIKAKEEGTQVTPNKDYVLFAQKVFRSTDVDVVSIDDSYLGKVNVVTKGPINWIDNNEKMSFFSKDVSKLPNDEQCSLELANIALCAAKAKGWGKLKITVANDKLAEAIKVTAESLGISNIEISIKESPILEKQEQKTKYTDSEHKTTLADKTLSEDQKIMTM
jgi:hypothetical protein